MLQQNAVLTFTANCSKIAVDNIFRQRVFVLKRKYLLFFVNICFPLAIGLLMYLFCYKNTYINIGFEKLFNFSRPYFYFDNNFHRFLTCYACDILWAYSLTFALCFCFKDFKKPLLICSVLSILLAIVIELLQINRIIHGTFDIWDIILEISAILFAVIIIKKEFLKWKKSYQSS